MAIEDAPTGAEEEAARQDAADKEALRREREANAERTRLELEAAEALGWPLAEIRDAVRLLRRFGPSRILARTSPVEGIDATIVSVRFLGNLAEAMVSSMVPFPKNAPDVLLGGIALIRDASMATDVRALTDPEIMSLVVRGGSMVRAGLESTMVLLRQRVDGLGPDAAAALGRFETQMKLRELVSETQEARDQARQAAGATGESALAGHFGTYARREQRTADLLRGLTVATLLCIAAIAAWHLLRGMETDVSATAELVKLALGIPLLALAAYFAREATRHRAVARWAANLEVQLLTVEAYTSPLTHELRDQIRADLGRRVFTTEGPNAREARSEIAPGGVAEASALVENVTQLVKGLQRREGG